MILQSPATVACSLVFLKRRDWLIEVNVSKLVSPLSVLPLYNQVYSEDPVQISLDFKAEYLISNHRYACPRIHRVIYADRIYKGLFSTNLLLSVHCSVLQSPSVFKLSSTSFWFLFPTVCIVFPLFSGQLCFSPLLL